MKRTNFKLSRDEMKYIRNIAILALILNLIVEVLNTNSVIATLSSMIHKPHIFFYNSLIILVTLSITLLIKHRLVICSLVSIIWISFGITNNILLHFRTTPFTAVDLSLISEALPILDKYLTPVQIVAIIIAVVIVIIGLVFAFIKLPKHKGLMNYISNICAVALILCLSIGLTSVGMKTNVLAKNFGNIGDAFKEYGFAYCFTNSLINTGIDKPSNYSEETIQTIVEAAEETPTPVIPTAPETSPEPQVTPVESKTPNVLFLQLESFFDPTHVEGMTFSSDPIPNFHKLQENYTSGFLSVPSVGAGTANTEFEIITGMDLDFFGPGEYPYKTILKETACESMAYNLKELGYSTHAIHNNTATFYGRNKVFSNLGFDTFTSEEYMENITYNLLGWAHDDVLVEEIINAMDSTDTTDYIYTISVQGHGKYPQDAESLYNGAVSEGIDGDFTAEVNVSSADSSEASDVTPTTDVTNAESNSGNMDSKKESAAGNESIESVLTPTPSVTSAKDPSLSSDSTQPAITIDGIDEDRKFAFEYYVNQIHEMDEFIGNLITALEAYDEDVILVMYGDHLPSLGIEVDDLDNKDMYQTEYVIWSSKGVIDGQHDRDLQAYQLSSYTLFLINQNPGLLTKLHQKEFVEETSSDVITDPTVTPSITNTTDVAVTPPVTDSSDMATSTSTPTAIPYLDELELLQYDMLYGKQECFNKENPYKPTELQMGVEPIVITSVTKNKNLVTVTGSHFTAFSKVIINDEYVNTTMVDHNTLTFTAEDLPAGAVVCVAQVNEEGTEISRTMGYVVK